MLLLDLPPGTGDIAISVAQLIPGAEILVVTTPQQAAAEVAERAGLDRAADPSADRRRHREHVLAASCPDGSRQEIFGSGGGQSVADSLTRAVGAPVPLLGQIPIDTRLREGGDQGMPVVLADPDSPAAVALRAIARGLVDPLAGPGRPFAGPHPRRSLSVARGRAGDVARLLPRARRRGSRLRALSGVGVVRRRPRRVVARGWPTAP